DERMKLAAGRPLERQLMAAMGQLDCGQCGYLCKTYAEAIHSGTEPDLGKCVPGGRDTARQLKELVALRPAQAAPSTAPSTRAGARMRLARAERRALRAARPRGEGRSGSLAPCQARRG